jgi:transmembrane sensor
MESDDNRIHPSPIDDTRWERLDDYFADRLSLADHIEMERWIAEREDRQRLVAQMRDVWVRAAQPATPIGPVNLREVLNTLAARRGEVDTVPVSSPEKIDRATPRQGQRPRVHTPLPAWLSRYIPVAATALLLIGAFLFWTGRTPSRSSHTGSPMREMITRKGQRAEIRLADGSRVMVSVDSKLRIPADFGQRARDVYLDGEALFDVVHDGAKPFRVHTPHGIATDIGTKFDARAYPGDSSVTIVVAEGSVALRAVRTANGPVPSPNGLHGTDSLVLVPGDLGRAHAGGQLTLTRRVPVDQYLAWTTGRIVFDATPLADALGYLERWYDVDIRLADPSLASRTLNGSYHDESAVEILQDIALTLNARVDQHGRTITLVPRRQSY